MNPAIGKILRRDFDGKTPICLYCKNHFHGQKMELDHLDNDRTNNVLWNFAVCHSRCNQQKKRNIEYQHVAENKILWNKAKFFDNEHGITSEHEHINSNMVLTKLAGKFLDENLANTDKELDYADTVDCITYLTLKEIGHASQISTQRALKTLTCSIAPYKIIESEKGKTIVRRVE